jgi:hypothetical protein
MLTTNASPLAAQKLAQIIRPPMTTPPIAAQPLAQPRIAAAPGAMGRAIPGTLPVNASPVAAQRLAQLAATRLTPPSPVPIQQPANPALMAQRQAMPRGLGNFIR